MQETAMQETEDAGARLVAFKGSEIDRMPAIHHGAVKLAAAHLGVESFGMQVLDLPAGFDAYPEHDHAADAQEEVYVALRGAAALTVDGQRVALSPERIVRVAPSARRTIEPGPDGVRLLVIGCTMGRSYERPEGFRLDRAAGSAP